MHIEIKDRKGEIIFTTIISPKHYKTGSKGYYGRGKMEVEGKMHTVSIMLVEIGSKPKPLQVTEVTEEHPNPETPEEWDKFYKEKEAKEKLSIPEVKTVEPVFPEATLEDV
jgi:hypothetical protein